MKNRIEELDSLRGLAAMSVVFGHYLNVFHSSAITTLMEYGPLRIFVAGNEAVLLFFLLSGFVLALPFLKGKETNILTYSQFAVKRVTRIYLPYLVAIILAIICNFMLYKGNIEGLSDWFNTRWGEPITKESIVNHLLFLGEYTKQFNVVTWSLVEELRISLILPLLMFFVIRFKWKGNIGLIFSLFIGSILIRYILGSGFEALATTVHYSSIFVIGALIAKYKDSIVGHVSSYSNKKKILFVLMSLFLYLYAKPSFGLNLFFHLDNFMRVRMDFIFTILGASMIIIFAISIKRVSKFLQNDIIKFLGKISFSVYLYHMIILMSLVTILNGVLPIGIILLASLILTIVVSTVSYYYIELPSIEMGKKIGRWLSGYKKRVDKDISA